VTVQTYHGFAMRLTGHSYAERLAAGNDRIPDFDAVLTEALDLLEGRKALLGVAADTARERLLAGYRHILVDEYQDIDAEQYRLVSAIAGRTLEHDGEDARLTLLAVGDDDQNIYASTPSAAPASSTSGGSSRTTPPSCTIWSRTTAAARTSSRRPMRSSGATASA